MRRDDRIDSAATHLQRCAAVPDKINNCWSEVLRVNPITRLSLCR